MMFLKQNGITTKWIAQLQIDRAQAQALAERDALTGFFNRGAGERMLTGLITAPTESDVLIMFDIDHFKKVNDTHGHPRVMRCCVKWRLVAPTCCARAMC